jgi:hypothetical protein
MKAGGRLLVAEVNPRTLSLHGFGVTGDSEALQIPLSLRVRLHYDSPIPLMRRALGDP